MSRDYSLFWNFLARRNRSLRYTISRPICFICLFLAIYAYLPYGLTDLCIFNNFHRRIDMLFPPFAINLRRYSRSGARDQKRRTVFLRVNCFISHQALAQGSEISYSSAFGRN